MSFDLLFEQPDDVKPTPPRPRQARAALFPLPFTENIFVSNIRELRVMLPMFPRLLPQQRARVIRFACALSDDSQRLSVLKPLLRHLDIFTPRQHALIGQSIGRYNDSNLRERAVATFLENYNNTGDSDDNRTTALMPLLHGHAYLSPELAHDLCITLKRIAPDSIVPKQFWKYAPQTLLQLISDAILEAENQ